jgi:hypothetical protein
MVASYKGEIRLAVDVAIGRPVLTGRKGRPRAGNQESVALAYAARKMQLGPKKAEAAADDIARLWNLAGAGVVKNAYTANRGFVDREISSIIERFTGQRGRPLGPRIREKVLTAIQDDLLDERKRRRINHKK